MVDLLVPALREDEALDQNKEWRVRVCRIAANRIESLEYALRSIAEVPLGKDIPDRTTIWGLATYMQEAAKDALKEGK